MPELLLFLGVILAGCLYTKVLKTKVSKIFCVVITVLFFMGHAMNLLVIRLNGGKMPVIESAMDRENAIAINLPRFISDTVLHEYLPKAQSFVLRTDKPHRMVSRMDEAGVRLKFLADKYPVRIAGHYALCSIGDVFIYIGTLLLIVGFLPIWFVSRYLRKKYAS